MVVQIKEQGDGKVEIDFRKDIENINDDEVKVREA